MAHRSDQLDLNKKWELTNLANWVVTNEKLVLKQEKNHNSKRHGDLFVSYRNNKQFTLIVVCSGVPAARVTIPGFPLVSQSW